MPSQRKSSGGDPDVKSEVQEWPAEVQNQRCLGCGSLEEHDMLLCDGTGCSAGWHLQCLNPPLKEIPEGDWFCPCCRVQSGGVPEPPRQAAPPPLEKHLGGTSGQGGSKARRASGAVGGTGEVPIGIDPESLEEENNQDHCVCDLCGFLMVEPTQSGCLQGHSFCQECLVPALKSTNKCPRKACGQKVDADRPLVSNIPLKGLILNLCIRCPNGTAKRQKRGGGGAAAPQGLGCMEVMSVGELAAHLKVCEFATVECANVGCQALLIPKDVLGHAATCEHRVAPCTHCSKQVGWKSIEAHQNLCPKATVKCATKGCKEEVEKGLGSLHVCQHQEMSCPACEETLLRKDVPAHWQTHAEAHELAEIPAKMEEMKRKISDLEDKELSEKRHAHPSTKTLVFNWRAEGWGPGYYASESFDLGGGGVADCVLKCGDAPEVFSHFIGFDIVGEHKTLRVHATMSVLDKEDRTLRQVYEIGTAAAPKEVSPEGNDGYYGIDFTPTKAEQDASVRPDGSVRLRAVVRVF